MGGGSSGAPELGEPKFVGPGTAAPPSAGVFGTSGFGGVAGVGDEGPISNEGAGEGLVLFGDAEGDLVSPRGTKLSLPVRSLGLFNS